MREPTDPGTHINYSAPSARVQNPEEGFHAPCFHSPLSHAPSGQVPVREAHEVRRVRPSPAVLPPDLCISVRECSNVMSAWLSDEHWNAPATRELMAVRAR